MTLDRETIRLHRSQADDVIRALLIDRLKPNDACLPQQIAKAVFPEWPEMSKEQFVSAINFCRRRMHGTRREIYDTINSKNTRPQYFPFPFPLWVNNGKDKKKTEIFVYFNAINDPWFGLAIKRMQSAARGLNYAASRLTSVSGTGTSTGNGANSGGGPA